MTDEGHLKNRKEGHRFVEQKETLANINSLYNPRKVVIQLFDIDLGELSIDLFCSRRGRGAKLAFLYLKLLRIMLET